MQELGERVARLRLNKNMTQEELARQAGIGSATLKRIEHGSASTQLSNFISVLRVLGLDHNLQLLVPDVPPSPVQLASIQKKNISLEADSHLMAFSTIISVSGLGMSTSGVMLKSSP